MYIGSAPAGGLRCREPVLFLRIGCADACRFYPGGRGVLMRAGSAPAGGQAAGNRFYSCGLVALMRAGSAPADVGRSCADLPAGRSIRQRYAFPEHFVVSDKVSDFSLCMQMG